MDSEICRAITVRAHMFSPRMTTGLSAVIGVVLWMLAPPADAKTLAYVPLETGVVKVIDTATNDTIDTIALGVRLNTFLVAPSGATAYEFVPNFPSVLAITTPIKAVTGFLNYTTDVNVFPVAGIAISRDGSWLATLVNYAPTAQGLVEVFDTSTNQSATILGAGLEGNSDWTTIAFHPNGKLYALRHEMAEARSTLRIGDPSGVGAATVVTVPVGNVTGIAFSPNGALAYLVGSDGLAAFDTATNTVTKLIALDASPSEVVFHPDGTRAYVATAGAQMSVIDTALQAEIATVRFFNDTTGVAITPDGKFVYVALKKGDGGDPGVAVIDTTTNNMIGSALQDGDTASPTHIVIAAAPSPPACETHQRPPGRQLRQERLLHRRQ